MICELEKKMSTRRSFLNISEDEFDALPFGIIRIDREGKILQYNAYEEQLSGHTRDDVVGKNFFTEVAPCTDVADFHGRLLSSESEAMVNVQFPFIFPFKSERHVLIHIVTGPGQTYWIFVSERTSERTIEAFLRRENRAKQDEKV
jgi:photoactive yellow protein